MMATTDVEKKRVCVIGAGPSGLASLRSFQSAKEKGAKIPEIVCYEKQSDWGGIWNYSNKTGTDQYGESVHTSMYRYLFSNGPKECLEFADYTFEEHFGKPIPSFPPRPVLWDYIQGRVKKAGVRQWCRFSTPVRLVTFDESSKMFSVTVHDLVKDRMYTEQFDNVICASGHFSVPNQPHFDGMEEFGGRIMHAHDFRNAVEFKGQDVLVIGGSYSAEDISSQIWKYGAKSVTISTRTQPFGYFWPSNIDERPLLTRIDPNTRTCHFKDGSSKDFDAIIFCTGYIHYFPFLTDELRLKTNNRLWPLGLYKGVAWEDNPGFFYLGMQDQWYTFNYFDVQAWYARDVILGRITLPDKATMQADSMKWRKREETLETDRDMIWFQGDHLKELMNSTDYPSFDVDGCNRTFEEWEHHKAQGIMTFRDHSYKSLITGTMSPPHHTPWAKAMDDSMESFLKE